MAANPSDGLTVGAGHGRLHLDQLAVGAPSAVRRLPAAPKLAGLFAFVTVVAVTPRWAVGALVADAALVVALVVIARVPALVVLRRLVALAPFLAFALTLPLIGTGEQVDVGPVALSVDGLWAMWNLVAKATIGATAAIVLTATTPVPDIVRGLEDLRFPRVIVAIVAFMVRYLELVADQLGRTRLAMTARAHDPRWLWQIRPIASSVGSLFVRTYERGERVHLAMAARGFEATMPVTGWVTPIRRSDVVVALLPAVAASTFAITIVVGT